MQPDWAEPGLHPGGLLLGSARLQCSLPPARLGRDLEQVCQCPMPQTLTEWQHPSTQPVPCSGSRLPQCAACAALMCWQSGATRLQCSFQ